MCLRPWAMFYILCMQRSTPVEHGDTPVPCSCIPNARSWSYVVVVLWPADAALQHSKLRLDAMYDLHASPVQPVRHLAPYVHVENLA